MSTVGMLGRLWKPVVGTAVLVGGPSYLYFKYTSKPLARENFQLPVRVRGEDGKHTMVNKMISLLTMEEVNDKLKENAKSVRTPRPGGIIWRQDTAFLAANSPIEDANASKIIERDPSDVSPPGDLLFFTVMDGHGGPYTSRLLSKVLIPAVAMELALLLNNPQSNTPKSGTLEGLKSLLWPKKATPIPLDPDTKHISLAIQRAFTNLDSEIVDSPLRLVADAFQQSGKEKLDAIPDLSSHPKAQDTIQPAMSGSCALMALFDTAHKDLYVACTGDSRAVAGVWEEGPDGQGTWRVDVLTEDQTGRNPDERKRLQSEHPPDEATTVIMRGRVLGGLEPTRAFGDARYKWSLQVQALLNKAFFENSGESMRSAPALLKTPPYVTARPVVTHRKIDGLPSANGELPSPKPKSTLRFLVLATDGLWDQLTSEDVVALVGGHLAGLKGLVSKSTLPTLVPTSAGSTVEGKGKHRDRDTNGSWAFIDDNISTHLIRNAFGGGDEEQLRQLVSIPAPLARNYRDDITCTVVYWEEGQERDAKVATFNAPEVKAKL